MLKSAGVQEKDLQTESVSRVLCLAPMKKAILSNKLFLSNCHLRTWLTKSTWSNI